MRMARLCRHSAAASRRALFSAPRQAEAPRRGLTDGQPYTLLGGPHGAPSPCCPAARRRILADGHRFALLCGPQGAPLPCSSAARRYTLVGGRRHILGGLGGALRCQRCASTLPEDKDRLGAAGALRRLPFRALVRRLRDEEVAPPSRAAAMEAALAIPVHRFSEDPRAFLALLDVLRRLGADTAPLREVVADAFVADTPPGLTKQLYHWMRQLVASGAWLELGLADAVEERLLQALPHLAGGDAVACAAALQKARCDRADFWAAFLVNARRRLHLLEPDCLAQLLHIEGRSTLSHSHGLFDEAARVVAGRFASFSDDGLAKMFRAFHRVAEPRLFARLVCCNEAALQAILDREVSPPLLYSLINGLESVKDWGSDLARPSWWQRLVLQPWGRILGEVVDVVQAGPCGHGGIASYTAALQRPRLGDLGAASTCSTLATLRFGVPSASFLAQAVEAVFVARAAANAIGGASLRNQASRCCGFMAFRIGRSCVDERTGHTTDVVLAVLEGRSVWSGGAKTARLTRCPVVPLSVPIGFLDERHPRDNDIELFALRLVLHHLRAAAPQGLLEDAGACAALWGEVDIFVDRTTCLSCLGALAQFRALLPGVRVAVSCEQRQVARHVETDV